MNTGLIVQASVPGEIGIISIMAYGSPTTINLETKIMIIIQPEVTYPINGFLQVNFPQQFSFNSTDFSCAFTNIGLEGSAFCSRNNSIVFVNNSYYPSITNEAIFIVQGVINPNSTAPTDSFFFQTFDASSSLICKSYSNFSYSATPGNLLLIGTVNKTATLAGSPFNFTAQISTSDNFSAGGYIMVFVPLEQGLMVNTTPICRVLYNNLFLSPNCIAVNQSSGVTIWINEWCSNGQSVCLQGMTATLYINNTLINPYFISQNVIFSHLLKFINFFRRYRVVISQLMDLIKLQCMIKSVRM